MKKCLTIEDLKGRIGKPVFITSQIHLKSNGWNVLTRVLDKDKEEPYKYFLFISGLSIRFHEKIDFRFFDTEVSDMELKEILDLEEKLKKKTGYERVEGAKYYTISSGLEVNSYDDIYEFDEEKYNIANYFNDENLAKNIVRAERLKYQLRRFTALNGGIPSKEDWADCEIFKYYVAYNYGKNKIYANFVSRLRDSFQIYFKNKEACEKAIGIFKDELIWYFTEFQEMLY